MANPIANGTVPDVKATKDSALSWQFDTTIFTDEDNDITSYSAKLANGDSLPEWLTFDSNTRTFTGTPPNGTDLNIIITATDATAGTAEQPVKFIINAAPVATDGIEDAAATKGDAFELATSGFFSDEDITEGDELTYTLKGTSGTDYPAWLSIGADGKLTGTPTDGKDVTVTVIATDKDGLTAEKQISIVVNAAPVATDGVEDAAATKGDAFELATSGFFSDEDITNGEGDELTYTLKGTSGTDYPAWLSIGADGKLTGTPTDGKDVTVTVVATDKDGLTAEKEISIVVNAAPVATDGIEDAAATKGDAFELATSGFFSDEDITEGDELTYTLKGTSGTDYPAWLSIGADGKLTGTPTDGKDVTVTVVATDKDGLTAEKEISIVVNAAPVATDGVEDAAATKGDTFELATSGFFSDEDITEGDQLTYTLKGTSDTDYPAWLSIGADGKLTGTPTDGKDVTVTVIATDKDGLTAEKQISIVVNVAPEASAGIEDAGTATQGQDFSWTLPTGIFTDEDITNGEDDELTYSLKAVDGSSLPSWLQIDPTTGAISGKPNSESDVNFIIVATDKAGATAEKEISLVVNADPTINTAPIALGEIADINARKDKELSWVLPGGSFIDLDEGDSLTYSLAAGAPSWLTIDEKTGKLTGTPDTEGDYTITIIATDNGGETASHEINIGVGLYDNVIVGTTNNDNLRGTDADDSISGGAGNDVITDTVGKNYLDGGEGNDKITGTGTLVGGKGNDTLTANVAGNSDTFVFNKGDGTDTIVSVDADKTKKGEDIIEFGAGITKDDLTFQRTGNNLVIKYGDQGDQVTINNYFAGANYQTINKITFADDQANPLVIQDNMKLEGTTGNDNIVGSIWNDTITGGAGNDVITDIQGVNYLDGGEGNDKITGAGTLVGGKGNDTLTANVAGSSDTFKFDLGDGIDTIISVDADKTQKGEDVIAFGTGIDEDSLIFQRTGNNLVIKYGDQGDQVTINNYFAGANYQTINKITFADDQANPLVIQDNMKLEGTMGNDKIVGSIWNDTITGGAGNDVITDIQGVNYLDGGEGNDKITGAGTLVGGKGNDTLTANVAGSSDTFIFNKGDGTDTIVSVDADKTQKGQDVIEFGIGITKDDLIFQRTGNNLVIKYGDQGDQVTINNYFAGANYQTINKINFEEDQANPLIIQDNMKLEGTTGNDNIVGSIWNDTILGGVGNDVITDIQGVNYLDGGEGNDKITGAGTLVGGKGNDTLTANVAGSSDTFKFDLGDGIDTIISIDADKTQKGQDVIEFGAGISIDENFKFQRTGNNLIIKYGDQGDQITINNYFVGANYQTINEIVFTDSNTSIYIQDNMKLHGTDANDNIVGSIWNDTITGGAGNDVITDIQGVNYLDGGEGNDKITGAGTLVGGKGNDTLTASVAGSSDTFIFNKGDGTDTIVSVDADKTQKGEDVIEFGTGITKDDLIFQRTGNNLVIKYGDQGDQVTINNYFAGANYQTINKITFADDQANPLVIQDNMKLEGTTGNDNIVGSIWNDTILGGTGNDVITDVQGVNYLDGGEGNDKITGAGTLVGGKGNDTLTANVAGSSDTFIFNKGDGQDTIISLDTATADKKGQDVIQFGDGITQDDISYQRKGNNLILVVGDNGDQITINNYFAGANYQTINKIELHDGSSFNIQDSLVFKGTDANDNLVGSQWNDSIYGGAGNDVITDTQGRNYLDGGEGNDKITGAGVFVGGKGNDTLTANVAGSADTFLFNKGDGQDTIISVDTAAVKGKDVIQFGKGITADMVAYKQTGNNLVLTIGNNGDQITINNYFSGNNNNTIGTIKFLDGTTWQANGKKGSEFAFEPTGPLGRSAAAASIENQTNNLIDALASFAPTASANSLVDDKPLDLNSVLIAANVN